MSNRPVTPIAPTSNPTTATGTIYDVSAAITRLFYDIKMVRSYDVKSARNRYSLMVVFEGDEPVVHAVARQHRRPGYWKDRLR
jgi:hypothetical protein